jgi:type II secretory pathway pseudopilin PulG
MSARTALVRRRSGELQGEQGYLMVALLVALSVMAIMMGAALPAWHTLARREKEAELIFRGEQYSRAIGLWQRRFANAAPPSIDVLVEQRFLRKKYKDPITNGEFQILGAGGSLPGQTQQGQGSGGAAAPRALQLGPVAVTQGRGGDTGIVGGIVGVTSKSAEKSLRLYNSRDTYNQWIFMPVARAGGAGGAGAGVRGAGGRGDGRGADGRGAFDGRGVLDGRGRGPQGDGGRGGFDGRGRGPQGDGGRGSGGQGRGGQAPPRGRF